MDSVIRSKVSVISPTYNHEKYIAECIESVISQTFRNWEMILIDDGSNDRTAEIAQKYVERDSRICLIKQENIGIFRLAETYNKALSLSNGEYIAILEGDDYWEPEKLAIQVESMNNNPNAVLCWGKSYSRVGNNSQKYDIQPTNYFNNRKYYDNEPVGTVFNALLNDFITPLTYLIRQSALMKIGGFYQLLPFPAIDLNTVLKLSLVGRFIFIDKILGTWRIFPNQTTKTKSFEILEGSHKIVFEHYSSLNEQQKQLLVFNERIINQNYQHRKVITLTRSGRFKLIRKEYKDARKDYINAICSFGFIELSWKIRALVGFVFSYFHLDVEFLAKWIGKGSLKESTKK